MTDRGGMTRRTLLASPLAVACGRPTIGQGSTMTSARAALKRAAEALQAVATHGGYLWWYSEDLKSRGGERPATESQVWVQSPGTPAVGQAFLRAYEATGDGTYLDLAASAAGALVEGQLESGGWDYLIDFDPAEARESYRRSDRPLPEPEAGRRRNTSTYDDDTTQGALRFLMAVEAAGKGREGRQWKAIREAVSYGLGGLLRAQRNSTGGWPQRWDGRPADEAQYPRRAATIPAHYPREYARESYFAHYTLNDNTHSDCVLTCLEAYRRLRDEQYLQAALRGADFLVLAQLPAPQPAWAQQYNARMEPAWARAFEPPAVCTGESVGAIRTLMTVYRRTGEKRYLAPIPAALKWFEKVALAEGRWARLYELGTDRAIYGDRDGKIHYTLAEISEERRTGYGWEGDFGVRRVMTEYGRLQQEPPERLSAPPAPRAPRLTPQLAAQAEAVIKAQDARGRWLERGRMETRTFIRNMGVLCDLLAASRKE